MHFPRFLVEQTILRIIPFSKVKRNAGNKLLINGRCPICGDGRSKSKKRFYLYEKNDKFLVNCKNCNYSKSFVNFLKEHFEHEFDQLKLQCFDQIKSGKIFNQYANTQIVQEKIQPTDELHERFIRFFKENCVKLNEPHSNSKIEKLRLFAVNVMQKRCIPENIWKQYYVCFSGIFSIRIIIPFINDDGLYYNFQARDIHPKPDEYRQNTKYIFAKFDDIEVPDEKIYKQYLVDPTKTVYICEGILDSEFVENSVCLCGTGIGSGKMDVVDHFEDRIWCIDNPFCDKSGNETILKLLEHGEKCFVIPKEHIDCKDINDLCKKMKWSSVPEDFIRNNVYSGKAGHIKLKLSSMNCFDIKKPTIIKQGFREKLKLFNQ